MTTMIMIFKIRAKTQWRRKFWLWRWKIWFRYMTNNDLPEYPTLCCCWIYKCVYLYISPYLNVSLCADINNIYLYLYIISVDWCTSPLPKMFSLQMSVHVTFPNIFHAFSRCRLVCWTFSTQRDKRSTRLFASSTCARAMALSSCTVWQMTPVSMRRRVSSTGSCGSALKMNCMW